MIIFLTVKLVIKQWYVSGFGYIVTNVFPPHVCAAHSFYFPKQGSVYAFIFYVQSILKVLQTQSLKDFQFNNQNDAG